MPQNRWKIKASGDKDASVLNNFFIKPADSRYELTDSNGTHIAWSTGDPPQFNFNLNCSWTVRITNTPPTGAGWSPSGVWSNLDADIPDESGSWQSDAVPDPLEDKAKVPAS